jgi:O-antigen/teichoic acid export membrane protein
MSTPGGRSLERYRRAALTAVTAAVARVISLGTMVISVPLTMHYLGGERYGLWMAIGSVIAVMSFADLGLGNGLLNAIADANGRNDREQAQRAVSSTLFILTGIGLLLGVVFAAVYPLINWPGLFRVETARAASEVGPAMAALMCCFLVSLPLSVAQRVQLGYQEGFANNLWQAAGSLMSLGAILLAVYYKLGLVWLVLAMSGSPAVALLLNGLVLFGWQKRWLLPRWRNFSRQIALTICRAGLMFLVLQITVAVLYSADNIIIIRILGPEAVPAYSVPQRMFVVVSMLLSFVLAPLWPAYGEAIASGDIGWVRRTLHRSLVISAVTSLAASLALICLGQWILWIWVRGSVTASWMLLLGLGLWTVASSIGNALGSLMNNGRLIKFQSINAGVVAILAITAKIFGCWHYGIEGVIWAGTIAYVIVALLPSMWKVRRFFRELDRPLVSPVLVAKA